MNKMHKKVKIGLIAAIVSFAVALSALQCFVAPRVVRADTPSAVNTTELFTIPTGTSGNGIGLLIESAKQNIVQSDITSQKQVGSNTGVGLNTVSSNNAFGQWDKADVAVNGIFYGDSKFEYTVGQQDGEALQIAVTDLHDNVAFTYFVAPGKSNGSDSSMIGAAYLGGNPDSGMWQTLKVDGSTYSTSPVEIDYPKYKEKWNALNDNSKDLALDRFGRRSVLCGFSRDSSKDMTSALTGVGLTAPQPNGAFPAYDAKHSLRLAFTDSELKLYATGADANEHILASFPFADNAALQSLPTDGYRVHFGMRFGSDDAFIDSYGGNAWSGFQPTILSINGISLAGENVSLATEDALTYTGNGYMDAAHDTVYVVKGESFTGLSGVRRTVVSGGTGNFGSLAIAETQISDIAPDPPISTDRYGSFSNVIMNGNPYTVTVGDATAALLKPTDLANNGAKKSVSNRCSRFFQG